VPTVSVYRNGSKAGIGGGNPNPTKRGKITGWSAAAVRRHTAWLYSIDAPALDGVGLAITLTMKDTPASADDFHAMRRAFMKRVERLGALRVHWVVEWQRRGTPHLHCAVYFPAGQSDLWGHQWSTVAPAFVVSSWLAVAGEYGAQQAAQHYDYIDGALGWLQYLSKHAARGVKHYQRSGHPEGWDRTGRLWGHIGEWPTHKPMKFDLSNEAYWRYRRLVRSWTVANARASAVPSRVKYARGMLACPQPKLSAVRGVSGWLPEDVTLSLVALLIAEGHVITQRVDPDEHGPDRFHEHGSDRAPEGASR
jgi:hypothetical protein